jgi:uncharacterized protein
MQGRLKRSYRISNVVGRHETFAGDIPLGEMPRLGEMLLDGNGSVRVEFEFANNDLSLAVIRGQFAASLRLTCQRCLEPMDLAIDQPFELLIDASDEDSEAFDLESVNTSDGMLDVFEVIEDELLLAIPIIVMHEDASCNPHWQAETGNTEVEAAKNNPFAALEALKGQS